MDDLELALALADAADQISMARFGQADLVVSTKPDMTPVSDADRAVEQIVRERLAVARPEDAIVGEEYGGKLQSGRAWIIDPIDGTKNFVRGVPVWATLIALAVDGEPVVGVISAPALRRRWWAASGQGSWRSELGGEPIRNRVSAVSELADASLSLGDLEGWARESWQSLVDDVWRVRAYGDFWSHVMVAEGCVDIAPEPELSLWDMAALVPVVVEAGGSMTGWDGRPALAGTSVLTSNSVLHPVVLPRLNHG